MDRGRELAAFAFLSLISAGIVVVCFASQPVVYQADSINANMVGSVVVVEGRIARNPRIYRASKDANGVLAHLKTNGSPLAVYVPSKTHDITFYAENDRPVLVWCGKDDIGDKVRVRGTVAMHGGSLAILDATRLD